MERFDKHSDRRLREAARKPIAMAAVETPRNPETRTTEMVTERLQKKIGVRRTINAALSRRGS